MIIIDRMFRFFNKDIFLPKICHADISRQCDPCLSCKCKIFCRRNSGKPGYVTIHPGQLKINRP